MAGWAQSCTHLYSENLKQEHFFHIRLFLVREYGSADFVRNFSKKHLRVIKIHPMLVPILNIQAVKCNTSIKALLQCYIKFCRLTIDVQSCVLLLSVAANKPAHEQHSANLIKLWQHTILSADRAAVFWTLLNRENGGGDGQRLNPTVSYLLQISSQL